MNTFMVMMTLVKFHCNRLMLTLIFSIQPSEAWAWRKTGLIGLMKTNRKPIQNHQSETMFLFKMYTLESEFDRYLEHMASYQVMQKGLPVFLVGEFGTFSKIFMQKICGQNMIISSYLLIADLPHLDSSLFIKLGT